MKARRGMSFRKYAKPPGLLAEHPKCLPSTCPNMHVECLCWGTQCRSAATHYHGTATTSCCPFSSETAMAKKLNIRKFCSKNFRKCCQKCHPHAPALVLHTVPLLALHPLIPGRAHRPYLKTQIQAERKLCVAKSFSFSPKPQTFMWNEWGQFQLCFTCSLRPSQLKQCSAVLYICNAHRKSVNCSKTYWR